MIKHFFQIYFLYIKGSTEYYQKSKGKFQEKAREWYQDFSKEKKT